jgi:hypothetical protein
MHKVVSSCDECPFLKDIDGDYRHWCGLEGLASYVDVETTADLEHNPPKDCPLMQGPVVVEYKHEKEAPCCHYCGTYDMVTVVKVRDMTSCVPCKEILEVYRETFE